MRAKPLGMHFKYKSERKNNLHSVKNVTLFIADKIVRSYNLLKLIILEISRVITFNQVIAVLIS